MGEKHSINVFMGEVVMTQSRNVAVAATVILLLFTFAPNAGAMPLVDDLVVNEISGTFGRIGLDPGNAAYFELTQGAITQTAEDNVGGLVLADIGVDLTGYTQSGDNVMISGGTVTILNPTNSTTALFNVDSASLTQVLTGPVGIGYMSLDLTLTENNLIVAAGNVLLPSTFQAVITYNGLVVDSDGVNVIAGLNASGSASFSAIPEPTAFALLLGGVALLRKRRNQVSVR